MSPSMKMLKIQWIETIIINDDLLDRVLKNKDLPMAYG